MRRQVSLFLLGPHRAVAAEIETRGAPRQFAPIHFSSAGRLPNLPHQRRAGVLLVDVGADKRKR